MQTVVVPVAGQKAKSALPETRIKVQSFAYTAFGEQMGSKVSGFGYDAEAYDAATGMVNLRARQYEPTLNGFSQKDIFSGVLPYPTSMNRYLYVVNSPIMHIDPSGRILQQFVSKALSVFEQSKNMIKSIASSMNLGQVKNSISNLKNSISNLDSVDTRCNL